MLDYKSVCVVVMIFVPPWLTSRHTHRQNLTRLFEKFSQLSYKNYRF